MVDGEIPWVWTNTSSGFLTGAFTAPPVGYVLRIRGLLISIPAYATVTGPGALQINGAAGSTVAGAPGVEIYFQPSTTEAINVPIDFGEAGLVFPGTPNATLNTGGTPGETLSVAMWGAFTPTP